MTPTFRDPLKVADPVRAPLPAFGKVKMRDALQALFGVGDNLTPVRSDFLGPLRR
jgi:hypothetical protein